MRRFGLALLAAAALAAAVPPHAGAAFGLSEIDVRFSDGEGGPEVEAGSHPFAAAISFRVNDVLHPEKGVQVVDGAIRNLDVALPEGFVGNPTAVPRCETLDFLTADSTGHPSCSDATSLGTLLVVLGGGTGIEGKELVAVHNMAPSPGSAVKLGFWVGGVPTTIDIALSDHYPYEVHGRLRNASQIVEVLSSTLAVWGNPAHPDHDIERGACAYENVPDGVACPANIPAEPFLTLPRACTGPLTSTFEALSWWSGDPLDPGPPALFEQTVQSEAMAECAALRFSPALEVAPTSQRADSPSGLAATLRVNDEGILDPSGRAHSELKEARVALPRGMTINPSQAEGLATCSQAQLAAETPTSPFGAGCPAASKIGTIEVRTPLLEGELLKGSLFVAGPFQNPFGSLLAVYLVIKHPQLGVIVRLAGRVEPDPVTGQVVTTFGGSGTDPLPQLPVSEFRLRFREGGRSPLVTPPGCGTHQTTAVLTPWADPANPFHSTSSFEITEGPGGAPCPPAGAPPFEPGFDAGTANNSAATASPLLMHLTRADGHQDLTRLSSRLAEGLVPKLAGVGRCPQGQIEAAKHRSGRAELATPSCPPATRIGTTSAGAGAGSQLTYVGGTVYLAGPYKGAPLSAVVITPAVAGPFDVGTVVVQVGLDLDPKSAEGLIDGSSSDPIPHILAGIPLRVRDLQVQIDRPDFTRNPTSCEPMAIDADIWGGGSDFMSPLDDLPVPRSAPFQAADCARLGFKPRISLSLKGGTRRGDHPALRMVIRPRPGDANAAGLVLRFPRSAFVEQSHFRTICTRVQFAADACPAASIYGTVTATTPLLDEPLTGPLYLRSSDNSLPDAVADLHGLVDVETSARIDSLRGGLRATVATIPDAPLTQVVVQMQGGQKGLFVNSRNLCTAPSRAKVVFTGQNGKQRRLRPVVKPVGCGGKRG